MSKKILYFECFSGISGDMTVAALLDLGASRERLKKALDSLHMEDEFEIRMGRSKKCGIDAFDFDVILKNEEGHAHTGESNAHLGEAHAHEGHMHAHGGEVHAHSHGRNLADVLEVIGRLEEKEQVKERARAMFAAVAQAESKAHGLPVEQVHFHEVGAVDSIVDIISTAVCIDDIGADEIVFSRLYEGSGHVKCQHGLLPVPVPAVQNIVQEYGIVLHRTEVRGEMVTPTGAAIAAANKIMDRLPDSYRVLRTGIGAGKKEFPHANVLRAMLLETDEMPKMQERQRGQQDGLTVLEANMDDCTGEALAYTMEQLLKAGAKDVWYVPAVMKKNRPAYILNVLTDEQEREQLEQLIFKHSTTIGIRRHPVCRTAMERSFKKVNTSYGEAEVKVCTYDGITEYYPEYESIRKLCESTGAGFQDVFAEAVHAAGSGNECRDIPAAAEYAAGSEKECRGMPAAAVDTAETVNECCSHAREETVRAKGKALQDWMQEHTKQDLCVAFSGGVDSSLLLKAAVLAAAGNGTKVYGVLFVSRLSPKADFEIAKKTAAECGAAFEVLSIDESGNEELLNNPRNRCYLCKKGLFQGLLEWAEGQGIQTVIEGTNADDLGVFRPGLKAVRELGVLSPLAELGITKEEVRLLAAGYGLSVASRPSSPCMATRIPYDTRLDFDQLEKLEEGEAFMKELGYGQVRLRLHGEILRIEILPEQMLALSGQAEQVVQKMKGLGFKYITLDLQGFRSGSMDE